MHLFLVILFGLLFCGCSTNRSTATHPEPLRVELASASIEVSVHGKVSVNGQQVLRADVIGKLNELGVSKKQLVIVWAPVRGDKHAETVAAEILVDLEHAGYLAIGLVNNWAK